MRVLHLILTLERAGAQEVVRSLIAHHRELGVESVVATFVDGDMRRDIEALGAPVHVLGPRIHGIEQPWLFASELGRLRRDLVDLVRCERIDIVQTHLLHTLDFLALSLPTRVVWTLHNVDYLQDGKSGWPRLKRAAHRWLYRWNRRRFAAIVATSSRIRSISEGDLGACDRFTTIPNGVETRRRLDPDRTGLRRELGFDVDDPLVLSVGRLTEQKGQIHLVRAMRRVVDEEPRMRLLIAGEGELEDELRQAIRALGLEGNVRLLGLRTDIDRLLASVDVFALPSLWEGLSIALLEAMAASLPIVATRVSGTEEVLDNGRNGHVVEPRDEAALGEGLLELLRDRERAAELGSAARADVENGHSGERAAYEYLALFERVMAR